MRDLTLEELELISGGSYTWGDYDGEQIVVVADGDGGDQGDWGDWGDWGDDWYDQGDGGGDGGGDGQGGPDDNLVYTPDFNCSDAVAANAGTKLFQLGSSYGAEFGASIVNNGNGTFGLYEDEIHTQLRSDGVDFPAPTDGSVVGLMHNHPFNNLDYYRNWINMYPGGADWARADALVASGAANAGTLSIYIVDGFGTTREFRYADRALYISLDESDKLESTNLPGAVTPCGG